MDVTQASIASIDCRQSDRDVTSTEVLIIGFGLSAIPLIRELEKDGIPYLVISDGESIWDRLEKHDRLDFDLVSSMHTSLYSFELVNREATDRYLTAKQYLSFIRSYKSKYEARVIKDWVTSVENRSSHSIVFTRSGGVFHAKHLILSTAFRRAMNRLLNEFDYESAKGKTIAMTGMGDSINLMVSKLLPFNSRIILITNGFLMLDKLVLYDDASFTLDQLEYQNIRHLSHLLYRKTITTGMELAGMCSLIPFARIKHLYYEYPMAIPWTIVKKTAKALLAYWHSPFPNGVIVVKYWPIDAYQRLFDNNSLQQFIRQGYLLNDMAFFLAQGLVELWPKQATLIDREKQIIRWKDNVAHYDHIVEPDQETPNLPEIVAQLEGSPISKYEYAYRDNFMGIVPKQLCNVYFIGFTRPTSGGSSNIVEMQGLFVHKMITDARFNRDIYDRIDKNLRRYNRYYYPFTVPHADHVVYYGFYTDDLARILKINPRLSDCCNVRDLVLYFIFPNNAFKYRQAGPYKVDGVKEMMHQIYKNHHGFRLVINYLLSYALLQLTAYAAIAVAYYRHDIPAVALPLLLIIVLLNPITAFVAANAVPINTYINLGLLAGIGLTTYYKYPFIPITSLCVVFALTYVFRILGWTRMPFNDLRNKKKKEYREFFERYCCAFRGVFRDIGSRRKEDIERIRVASSNP
jgi:hypothetical protein